MQSIYGPPPGSRPRRRLEKRGPSPLRRALGVIGLIALGTGCFVLLVMLEVDDGPDFSNLRIPINMPMYDHAAMFNNLDANAFRPLKTASIIPSSAIHPATNSAPARRRRTSKPLKSAGIIQR